MQNYHIRPLALQVLDDQPAVTAFGGRFATEQDARGFKVARRERIFDVTIFHQLEELRLVYAPVSFVFLVGVQDILRGGQQRLMHVLGTA